MGILHREDAAGQQICAHLSLREADGANPQDYLNDVLRQLPEKKINQIDALLPGNWKSANADSS